MLTIFWTESVHTFFIREFSSPSPHLFIYTKYIHPSTSTSTLSTKSDFVGWKFRTIVFLYPLDSRVEYIEKICIFEVGFFTCSESISLCFSKSPRVVYLYTAYVWYSIKFLIRSAILADLHMMCVCEKPWFKNNIMCITNTKKLTLILCFNCLGEYSGLTIQCLLVKYVQFLWVMTTTVRKPYSCFL